MSERCIYVFLYVLSRRFGDSYGTTGDSVCIQETPGYSRQGGIDACLHWMLPCHVQSFAISWMKVEYT